MKTYTLSNGYRSRQPFHANASMSLKSIADRAIDAFCILTEEIGNSIYSDYDICNDKGEFVGELFYLYDSTIEVYFYGLGSATYNFKSGDLTYKPLVKRKRRNTGPRHTARLPRGFALIG